MPLGGRTLIERVPGMAGDRRHRAGGAESALPARIHLRGGRRRHSPRPVGEVLLGIARARIRRRPEARASPARGRRVPDREWRHAVSRIAGAHPLGAPGNRRGRHDGRGSES